MANDELRRLTQRLHKSRGNDPVSQARKIALLRAILELQEGY